MTFTTVVSRKVTNLEFTRHWDSQNSESVRKFRFFSVGQGCRLKDLKQGLDKTSDVFKTVNLQKDGRYVERISGQFGSIARVKIQNGKWAEMNLEKREMLPLCLSSAVS